MNGTGTHKGMSWSARLLVGLAMILVGAAAATWGLGHYRPAARFLGVTSATTPAAAPAPQRLIAPAQITSPAAPVQNAQLAELEERLSRVENATQRAEGFAGRADALVVAFAARRAIDRGVALGYLENLLVDRFGDQHQQAVAAIITGSRQPVRLNDLIAEYESIGPALRAAGPQESWWDGFRRELGSLVEVHRADRTSMNPDARYNRAMLRLSSGDVDQAFAETMRMPGAAQAGDWIQKARRYIQVHRALDEIESAALLSH